MPTPITHKEYKHLLKAAYGDSIRVISKIQGSVKPAKHECLKCGNVWETSPATLVSRKRAGTPLLKCGCPACGKAAGIKANTGKQGTTTVSEEEWLTRMADKKSKTLQPEIKLLSKYKTGNTKSDFQCKDCGAKFSTTPLLLVQRVFNCECANPRLRKNLSISKAERKYIKYMYRKLKFNWFQISKITGYAESTLRHLAETKGWIESEPNVFKRDRKHRLLRLQQRDTCDKKSYTHNARRLTQIIYDRYATILDHKSNKGNGWELDHMLSLSDAYVKSSKGPINLKVVCHPANLQMLTSKENKRKGSSSVGVSTLSQRIAEFEAKYGVVDFPEQFRYNYRLSPISNSEEGLRVLGFDPGTVNFGVAASTVYGTDSIERISVSEITMLENPMTDIAPDMYEQYAAFAAEIRSYIDTYDPHVIVVERFASRGLKGKTIELVGYMIGAIIAVVESYREKGKHIVLRPVMPASWKNQVNRVHDLDYLYKGFKTKKVVPHVVDAALMSLYAFPAKENPYLFLTNSAKRKQWIKNMLIASKL